MGESVNRETKDGRQETEDGRGEKGGKIDD